FGDSGVARRQIADHFHLRPESGKRRGETHHHIVEKDGLDLWKQVLVLGRADLGKQAVDKGTEDGLRDPAQPRITGQRLLSHETMELGKGSGVLEDGAIFLTQALER